MEKGIANPQVNAKIRCRLNGRPSVPFVDPEVNLAGVRMGLAQGLAILERLEIEIDPDA